MTDPLVPLGLLSLEGHGTVDQLAHRLGSEVVVDDAGIRCCSRSTARRLHDNRAAVLAAQRARMAAAGDSTNTLHAGLRARAERQRELRRKDPDLSAFEVMGLDSGDPDDQLSRAGRQFDEMMTANRRGLVGFAHRYNPPREG
jgi:hypothetical protein